MYLFMYNVDMYMYILRTKYICIFLNVFLCTQAHILVYLYRDIYFLYILIYVYINYFVFIYVKYRYVYLRKKYICIF